MIIIKLWGGLGNQMFQYALARNLAEKRFASLKLDVSDFAPGMDRRYNLQCFNIQEHIASQAETENFLKEEQTKSETNKFQLLRKLGNRITGGRFAFHSEVVVEKYEDCGVFNSAILQKKGSLYLMGCWQTEKYFKEIRNVLLKEFTIKYPQEEKNKMFGADIQNCNSVSIHVRRGDYISDPVTYEKHGVCSLDYYSRCVDHISRLVSNPHFFVFSDDPTWVRENIKLSHPVTYVNHNDDLRNYEDMVLMSKCKHNIIANSSFSWWGAWLNRNPDKIVCAPQRWVNDMLINTSDLVPSDWVKFNN